MQIIYISFINAFRCAVTGRGRPRAIRTAEVEEAVLHEVEINPVVSTRGIAQHMRTSGCTVWRVLSEQLLHPYNVQRVQDISPVTDYNARVRFCRWYIQKCAAIVNFV